MYYNISFDIAAILVLAVLAVGMKTVLYTDTHGSRLVRRYVYSVIFMAVIDIITAYTICYGYLVPDLLNLILNTLYQYSAVLCVALAMRTIFSYFPSILRRSVIINRAILYIQALFVTVNMFTGWLFRFENGEYIHGPIYLISYILSLAVVFHALYVVIVNRRDNSGVMIKIIVLFLFLPTVFTLVQMIVGDTLLIAFGEAFSALIMLFALETPDYRKLMKTLNELEIAKEEANIANSTKSDFLASMSHEIRTPINGILGMDTMILRDCDDPQIVEYAENIRIAGNGLLSIINDILDLSKIESGKMEIVPVKYALSSVLNDCFQMNRMRAQEKRLKFEIVNDPDMPDEFYGDEVRIRQILNNLISNGLKYTENGSVRLNVSLEDYNTERGDDGEWKVLVLAVSDTGIGIRDEDRDRLFKSFSRLEENRNRRIEGTGLGLRITDQLVGMMNGTIKVDSVYGEGSTFTVKIPQKIIGHKPMGDFAERQKENVSVAKSRTGTFRAPGKKILIVDDVRMNVLVFKGLLRGTEMTIDSALSGAEALEMTKYAKYDIIFMDHLMPEMDGIETFHRIRDNRDNPNCDVPVVVLTANAIVGVKDNYIKEGFDAYLSKPVEQKELLDMTAQILGFNKHEETSEV